MMMEYHPPGYNIFPKYLYGVMSSDSRTHGSGNHRVEMGMDPLKTFAFLSPQLRALIVEKSCS